MIHRTFDASAINEVANHPEVHCWLGVTEAVDLTPQVFDTANYTLMTEGGGFILIGRGDGVYEVHSQFKPEARRNSIKAMRAGFDYMFTRTDCQRILTQVPDNNPGAQALARFAKFRSMFRRAHTPRGPTSFMGLSLDEWIQDTVDLETDGHWFHEQLEAVKTTELHPDDPAHERAVGAAVRMILRGNAAKGVATYNRWALFAGYAPIALLNDTPAVIDVVDAVVEVRDDKMEILLCR